MPRLNGHMQPGSGFGFNNEGGSIALPPCLGQNFCPNFTPIVRG
jgi:hypothetical protein